MGSKGRVPPQHLRRPLNGPVPGHPEAFAPGLRTPHGGFPRFDMLPLPEVMEQKLAAQHADMQKLAMENQRLAATHGTLRQELAAAQHELQMVHGHIGAFESESEQTVRNHMDRIAKMESELQEAESLKAELQKARKDAQELFSARQELVSKVQDLTQDLQKAHSDMQQLPGLLSELENLRQEYHHCRTTYDSERQLYNNHLESLQVMEKHYTTMAQEVEKLRVELTNSANVDKKPGLPYGGHSVYYGNDAIGLYPLPQNVYNEGYGVHKGYGQLPGASGGAPTSSAHAAPSVSGGGSVHAVDKSGTDRADDKSAMTHAVDNSAVAHSSSKAGTVHVGDKFGTASAKDSYDNLRGPAYDAQRGFGGPEYDPQRIPAGYGYGYDSHRGHAIPGYDAQLRGNFDVQRGPTYDAQRGGGHEFQSVHGYDAQRGEPGYDGLRGPGYDAQRVAGYEVQRQGLAHGQRLGQGRGDTKNNRT